MNGKKVEFRLIDGSLEKRVKRVLILIKGMSEEEKTRLLAELTVGMGWCMDVTENNFDTLYGEHEGRIEGFQAALHELTERVERLESGGKNVH